MRTACQCVSVPQAGTPGKVTGDTTSLFEVTSLVQGEFRLFYFNYVSLISKGFRQYIWSLDLHNDLVR